LHQRLKAAAALNPTASGRLDPPRHIELVLEPAVGLGQLAHLRGKWGWEGNVKEESEGEGEGEEARGEDVIKARR